MNALLERIVATTGATVAWRKQLRPLAHLERAAARRAPRADGFRAALGRAGTFNVIAECKRRSPSAGLLRDDYNVLALARAYEAAGAAAISVLTEPSFFEGSLDDLALVRDGVTVPVLRKDFIVDRYQVAEARALGADAVLLIVAILGTQLAEMMTVADEYGLAALVEVHDGVELARAREASAAVIGVNSRDLRTMSVNQETCAQLAEQIPSGVVAVAESGIRTPADLARLRAVGYSAFLIGERLVRSLDPGETLRELLAGASGGALRQD